jgi:transposase
VAAYAGLAPTPWQSGSIDHRGGRDEGGAGNDLTPSART